MKGERYILHQKLIEYAMNQGIKAAARSFGCSRNTVRKWIRRYRPKKPASIAELSRRPHHSPNKTPVTKERKAVAIRKATGFSAERIRDEFGMQCSEGALKRIFRQHGLIKRRKKKTTTKKDLREIKKQWPLFGQLSVDTKYLTDLPLYWPQMKRLRLPRYQYTAREVVSGMTFTGYADEISRTYSCVLAKQIAVHLASHGVDLKRIRWQTDNGFEFLENKHNRGFPSVVRAFGSDHHYIPVKAFTWQSDVETVHRLVEDEFFDREVFSSPQEFWEKIAIYWYYFNIARPNRHKDRKTPLQIVAERNPEILKGIASWSPLDLGKVLQHYTPHLPLKRGHDVPAYP
jgi:transposase